MIHPISAFIALNETGEFGSSDQHPAYIRMKSLISSPSVRMTRLMHVTIGRSDNNLLLFTNCYAIERFF